LVERFFGKMQIQGRFLEHSGSYFHGGVHQPAFRHQSTDKADFFRLLCIHRPAGEQNIGRLCTPHQPRRKIAGPQFASGESDAEMICVSIKSAYIIDI
jgi:hypothetical protein